MDDQHGGGLADDGEPAQAHQGVEAHIAARMILGEAERAGMARQCNAPSRRRKIALSLRRGLRFPPAGASHLAPPWPRRTTPPVAVDHLVKIYKGVAAVDGIRFALPPGSITGLLGGNGAGKTTTIAMIMGLVTPTSGTVAVLGARDAAPALPRAAPDEFREPLCGDADAADGAAESDGVRRGSTASPISMSASPSLPPNSISTNCSTGRPASCRPARRPASRSPRR